MLTVMQQGFSVTIILSIILFDDQALLANAIRSPAVRGVMVAHDAAGLFCHNNMGNMYMNIQSI